MAILATYTKQPAERKDYDLDYSDWLPNGDTVASATATVSPSGLTVDAPVVVSGKTVKLWVSGGTGGVKYKVTVKATTTVGRIDEEELIFNVKDF